MQDTKEIPSGLVQQPKNITLYTEMNFKQPVDSMSTFTGAGRSGREPLPNFSIKAYLQINNQQALPAESVIGSVSNHRRIIGNHNICPKHKNNYINYCLSHAEPLCAECFEDHRGPQHDIQMLQNFAKK